MVFEIPVLLYLSMQITCPHCWETIDIEEIPYSPGSVELVIDCEVCCRPIAITAQWNGEEDEAQLDVRAES